MHIQNRVSIRTNYPFIDKWYWHLPIEERDYDPYSERGLGVIPVPSALQVELPVDYCYHLLKEESFHYLQQ